MTNKIIEFFRKLFRGNPYSRCYTEQEYIGGAVFGMCNKCDDKDCPYHAEI